MKHAHLLEDSQRVHDRAFYEWLGGLRVDYGVLKGKDGAEIDLTDFPVLRTFAAPNEAHARMRDILVRRGWLPPGGADPLRSHFIPLPFLSITAEDPEPDPERAGVPKIWRNLNFNPVTRTAEAHPHPAAYRLNYQVDIWAEQIRTTAYIREWLMSRFGRLGAAHNETFLHIPHEPPWGAQRQALRMVSFADASDVEIDSEKRYRRFTAQFEMNMLVFRQAAYASPVVQPMDNEPSFALSAVRPLFIDMIGPPHSRFPFEQYDRDKFPGSRGVSICRMRPFEYGVRAQGALQPRLRTGLRSVRIVPNRECVLLVRFSYTQTRDAVFSVLDGEDGVLQAWRLPAAPRPVWFEAFVPVERYFNFEWIFDAGADSGAVLRDMRYRIMWTENPKMMEKVSDGVFALRDPSPSTSYVVFGKRLRGDDASPIFCNKESDARRLPGSATYAEIAHPRDASIIVEGPVDDMRALPFDGGLCGRFQPRRGA